MLGSPKLLYISTKYITIKNNQQETLIIKWIRFLRDLMFDIQFIRLDKDIVQNLFVYYNLYNIHKVCKLADTKYC